MELGWIKDALIAAGSLIVSALGLLITFHYLRRSRKADDERLTRERMEQANEEQTKRIEGVCLANQGRYFVEQRENSRRIYERIEEVERGFHEKMVELSSSFGEMRGAIQAIQRSVNGELEEKLRRAVRAEFERKG